MRLLAMLINNPSALCQTPMKTAPGVIIPLLAGEV
jgi:hypothetical protein